MECMSAHHVQSGVTVDGTVISDSHSLYHGMRLLTIIGPRRKLKIHQLLGIYFLHDCDSVTTHGSKIISQSNL